MLREGRYTLSELADAIRESKSESKPKFGNGLNRDSERKTNEKAVDDIIKETGDYNNVGDEPRRTNPELERNDLNKTTLDVDFAYEPSQQYKDRVQAQAEGFPSKANKENTKIEDENKSLDFDGNRRFYKANKEKHEKVSDMEQKDAHAGLKARTYPEDTFKKNNLFKESKMKRLHFKNHTFLSEAQVIKHVPEEYKTDGNRFLVKDKTGTEYLVECTVDERFGYAQLNVVNKFNKEVINEQLDRIKNLYEYKSGGYFTGSDRQKDNGLSEMISHCKELQNSQK